MLEAFRGIREQAALVSQPILAVHGAKDAVCPLAFTQRFLNTCASSDKTLKVFPDALHDIMHDVEKGDVFEVILAWLEAKS